MRLFRKCRLVLFKRGTCNTDKASHYVIAYWHGKTYATSWALWWWPFNNYSLRTRLFGTFLLIRG